MCGINGVIQFNPRFSSEQIYCLMKTMNDILIHRGPDDEGLYINDNVGLGMRRLSIIDLATGEQPIYNEDKSLVIILNGEIYNYKTLKQDLIERGHVFTTKSDTEVVLHCFEEYGNQCFNKLKGMFAFAIYNQNRNTMVIVRDCAGEKPLYYYKDTDILLFSSELKSLISTGIIKKKICKKSLNQYLQLTYIPAPLTIFEYVYKLLPGQYMEICNGIIQINEYWDVKYNDNNLITDYDQCKSKLRSTLFNSVEECMVSDVPIGAFLSGGIDSAVIVGIMSKISNKPINTFTVCHRDKQYNEDDRAQRTANLHQTNHYPYYLNCCDILPELDKIIKNIDEPFADSSYLPTYMISKFSRNYVKTILTGDAGDELFGGYSKYLINYYSDKYNKIPKWFRKNAIQKVINALPDDLSITRKVHKVIENSDKSIFEKRRTLMCMGFKEEQISDILKDTYFMANSLDLVHEYYYKQKETDNELSCTLYTDLKVVLEGDILVKTDRASMLCSLETRVPMLHKDIIELAAQIPSEYKINAKNTKIILKDTFSDLIPRELLQAKKSGFGIPIEKWLRNELKEDLIASLNMNFIEMQGIFNYEYIKKILNDHLIFGKNRSGELWTLYIFQKWYNNFFLTTNV